MHPMQALKTDVSFFVLIARELTRCNASNDGREHGANAVDDGHEDARDSIDDCAQTRSDGTHDDCCT
jgi:hypothetical protein